MNESDQIVIGLTGVSEDEFATAYARRAVVDPENPNVFWTFQESAADPASGRPRSRSC